MKIRHPMCPCHPVIENQTRVWPCACVGVREIENVHVCMCVRDLNNPMSNMVMPVSVCGCGCVCA